MTPRTALIALLTAFSVASAVAAFTTIRQVHTATYALPQPVTHI
ncbi:hypothetical protein [Bradyrhizobium sp. STM 3809]|nr:hypothetical protein [Bradyrhizobium sp. STM 3809]CCE01780.1 exported hypothetical protein [Bradyrhizobium sp. STM 3809]